MAVAPQDHLAFALDVDGLPEAERWLATLSPTVTTFKVGLELFVSAGPAAVQVVHRHGARCFLDLKLHDIRETVARATRAAAAQRVAYLTVHAANGRDTLQQAADIAAEHEMRLLAITLLTNLKQSDVTDLGWSGSPADTVRRLAQSAFSAGVRGFVCSPEESAMLRAELGPDAFIVTPGIRPADAALGDQARVATPMAAIHAGSDLLVVGRPIRDAADPRAAATQILDEIAKAKS